MPRLRAPQSGRDGSGPVERHVGALIVRYDPFPRKKAGIGNLEHPSFSEGRGQDRMRHRADDSTIIADPRAETTSREKPAPRPFGFNRELRRSLCTSPESSTESRVVRPRCRPCEAAWTASSRPAVYLESMQTPSPVHPEAGEPPAVTRWRGGKVVPDVCALPSCVRPARSISRPQAQSPPIVRVGLPRISLR